MAKPAQTLTRAIRRYLQLAGWLTWRNSGGLVRVGGDRFARFGETGIPDIMAYRKGRLLCIEVKATKSDRLSTVQQAWLDALGAHGAICIVARSMDDLVKELEGQQ